MEALKLLSRSEMKNIKGGDPNEDCSYTGGGCLVCETPGGTEHWCRHESSSDPEGECEDIYGAYSAGDVSGSNQLCMTVE